MSFSFLFHYLMLNMYRMLIHPSSGACYLFVGLFHGLYCSVRIEVFALAYLFSGECLVVTCVVVLESVFLQILAAAAAAARLNTRHKISTLMQKPLSLQSNTTH
jgi:hypothetical protein